MYYTHFDDDTTPVEETMEAYAEIVKAGKVRYIAASNVSPERLRESFDVAEKNGFPKYVALQPHYNLVERQKFETEYESLVKEFNLSVFPYWALAAGFLTGKYRTEADFGKSVRGEGVRKYIRITSYNVCYTKLLRVFGRALGALNDHGLSLKRVFRSALTYASENSRS